MDKKNESLTPIREKRKRDGRRLEMSVDFREIRKVKTKLTVRETIRS